MAAFGHRIQVQMKEGGKFKWGGAYTNRCDTIPRTSTKKTTNIKRVFRVDLFKQEKIATGRF